MVPQAGILRALAQPSRGWGWARDPRSTVTLAGLLARLKRGLKPRQAITARKRREGVEPAGKVVDAWGVTKSLAAWARDRRARVGAPTIAKRLGRGMRAEEAITTPAFR